MKKKLSLHRVTLAQLDQDAVKNVAGGDKLTANGCVSYVRSFCGCQTRGNESCYC